MKAIETVEQPHLTARPDMRSGDTVRVHVKVREGDKERIQVFEGTVIALHRGGVRATFTVRKVSFGQGVERIFPLHSPTIDKIDVIRSAKVRRAKLYFLRDLKGKAARMKETKRAWAGKVPSMRGASRSIENELRRLGYVHVAGVDEVGRGCLAGPVVAAAVVLRAERYVAGVADSKLLTAAHRERLFDEIVEAAVSWRVAVVDAGEIDRLNIHRASLFAMELAVMGLEPLPGFVVVDGFRIPNLLMAQRAIPGGDRKSTAIAAASILAKVTRDKLMHDLHAQDPRYGFDRHKGYATKDHLDAVSRFGYSPVHRRTFRPPSLFDTMPD